MSEEQRKIDFEKHAKGSGSGFLKAESVKVNLIRVKLLGFREENLQFSGMSLIMDFEYKKEKQAIPMNTINTRKLMELSENNPQKLIGSEVVLKKVLAYNPKLKKEVHSWRLDKVVARVKEEKVK